MPATQKRFYIVEDDKSVRRALVTLVIALGHSARSFASAEAFFNAVPNHAPGCVILDVHLPGLNGWEAQQHLRASGSQRPVIIISVDTGGELMERAYKAGAVGYLQKPFKDQELADLIHLVN